MDKKFLESTEFYDARHQDFSKFIIIPMVLLLFFSLLFSIVGKKEITVKGIGKVVPRRTVSKVQSISNNQILVNNLENNKKVKKNDVLIVYDTEPNKLRIKHLEEQLDEVRSQLESAQLLEESLEKGESVFKERDKYGYFEIFESYLNDVFSVEYEISVENASIIRQNKTIENIKLAIKLEQEELEIRVIELLELKGAVTNDEKLYEEHTLYSKYLLYESQMSKEPQLKEELKNMLIIEIDETIIQIQSTLKSLNTQKKNVGSTLPIIQNSSNRVAKIKHQELINSRKEIVQLENDKDVFKREIAVEERLMREGELKATTSGILNVEKHLSGSETIAIGVTIAEIFPELTNQEEIEILILIAATDIVGIKPDLPTKFKIIQSIPKMKILEGKVNNVSVSPVDFEGNSYFEVSANIAVTEKELLEIEYGLLGESVIVIGKKTFFNYYKEKLLNNQ